MEENSASVKEELHFQDGFEVVRVGNPLVCSRCKSITKRKIPFFIPNKENGESFEFRGSFCANCNRYYISMGAFPDLETKLAFNDKAAALDIKYNGKTVEDITKIARKIEKRRKKKERERERKKELQEYKELVRESVSSIPSVITVFEITTKSNEKKRYTIVGNKKDANIDLGILYYMNKLARDLLAHRFQKCRRSLKTIIQRDDISAELWIDCEKYGQELRKILVKDVFIQKDGGFVTKEHPASDLTYLFLFSPYSDTYEYCLATYDRETDSCFVDIKRFREFIKKNGNPRVGLKKRESSIGGFAYYDLQEESLLKAYGYTVAERPGLNDKDRQELLAEIIDLGYMSRQQTMSHLEFCIRMHMGIKYKDAREKWVRDYGFLETYEPNPRRFLFAKNSIINYK